MGDLSLQKLSANQKNAQLSTGPKTEAGMAKSALNAVKHGIFTKECLKNISDEEARDYEMLRLGVFESLKPKDQMQAILCDKITIDAWRLRKVLAFEQGAIQLEILNLDASCSSVEVIRRESLIRDYENHKAEWAGLNQLKKWLTSNKTKNLSHLSRDSYELLEDIVQNLKQRFPENYRHMDIELSTLASFVRGMSSILTGLKPTCWSALKTNCVQVAICRIITRMASGNLIISVPFMNP